MTGPVRLVNEAVGRIEAMIVRGPNLFLRTIRETDLDWLYARFNDIEARGAYYPAWVMSETELKERFRKDGFWSESRGQALICANDTEAILGQLIFFQATPYWDSLELGYRLYDVAISGRGIMTEALSLFTYTMFSVFSVNRLELKIVPENKASVRVAEKCGYQLEGVAREAWLHRGRHHDMAIYSLLRHEFPSSLPEVLARLPSTDN